MPRPATLRTVLALLVTGSLACGGGQEAAAPDPAPAPATTAAAEPPAVEPAPPAAEPVAPADDATPTDQAAPADPAAPAGDIAVARLADGSYEIDGVALERAMASAALAAGARLVPAIKDGKPVGFKLYAIRPSSFFARIGLANGDLITAVNGHALTSPDEALAAYDKVKGAERVVVALERKGAPLDISLRIKRGPK